MGTTTKVKEGQILNYDYTGGVQSIMLPPGSYKLECWGAQGGYRSNATYGGKGGYSIGELTLNEETTLYVQVGGSGNTGKTSGGYNGGGKRNTYNGGGGGTDIRIGQDSLYARVIVAGGGGSDGAPGKKGMYGGGESGGSSTENYGAGGFGGTQTGVSDSAWQTTNQSTGTGTKTDAYAGFGFGGNGIYINNGYGGAGGGGWYGGSGAYPDSSGDDDRGGGGGSGYIYTSSTASNYPSGCLLNSSYYLTNAQTIAGNTSFPSPNGGTETGHEGNGYARITVLAIPSSISAPVRVDGQWHQANELFVKVNNVWKECVEGWMKVDGVWKSLVESTIPYDASWLDGLTLGSTFNFGKYQVESETPWPIEWEIVHQTDDYQIAMTKQIIDLRCFDAKEPTNPNSDRKRYGNNNWQYSNIEQFLNSDQASWYKAQHQYDAPPTSANCWQYPNGTTFNAYDSHKGFLYHWSNEDKALLKDMTLTLANNTVTDGGGSYTWTGKVFLPTYTQMGFGNNNNIAEGVQFSKFTDNNSRKKSLHPNCIANNEYCKLNNRSGNWLYLMSSVYPSYSRNVRYVDYDGSGNSFNAYDGGDGLAPCICLPRYASQTPIYHLTVDLTNFPNGPLQITTSSGDSFSIPSNTTQTIEIAGEQNIVIDQSALTASYHPTYSGCITLVDTNKDYASPITYHIGGSSTTGTYSIVYNP